MFGRRAFELIQEVATCQAEGLPAFNEDSFQTVLNEITLLHERLSTIFNEARERYRQRRIEEGLDPDDGGNPNAWRGTDAEASELMVYHTAILRNKQLLFNYVKLREEKIQGLRWTHRALPAHVRANLSPAEQQYFRGYDQLLNKYMRSGRLGVGLDLTVDPTPPDDPYVQVTVLRDYGEVLFTSGKVLLERGKRYWLPGDEAHPLVMDGVLEYFLGDEKK